jgi:hypothetical protein
MTLACRLCAANVYQMAVIKLWDSSTSPAEDKKDHAHHQEYKKQNLRNSCRRRSNAAKSQYRRNKRNY